jgi:hypothetical protein
MASVTLASEILPALSITYDDVSGDITEYTFNATHPSVTADYSGKALNANRDEVSLVTLFQEFYSSFSAKLTDLDCPIAADVDNAFFENEGTTDRDSGETDVDGNPITEKQLFQKLSFLLFYQFQPSVIFNSASAVNDND